MSSPSSLKVLPSSSLTENIIDESRPAKIPNSGSNDKKHGAATPVDDDDGKNKKLKSNNHGTGDQQKQEFDCCFKEANFSEKQQEFFKFYHSQMQTQLLQMQTQTQFLQMQTQMQHSQMETRLSEMETRLAKSEGRLNQFVQIMKPARKHALFETSIYAYVDLELQQPIEEVLKKNIQYGISVMCASVLCRLLLDHHHITWRPSKKSSFTPDARVKILKAGLKGLLEFVKSSKPDDVKEFTNNFADRNTLAHNGDHLDAYNTPPKRPAGVPSDFSAVKAEITLQRKSMTEDASRGYISASSIRESVDDVVAEMQIKGVPPVSSHDVDKIVSELEKAAF